MPLLEKSRRERSSRSVVRRLGQAQYCSLKVPPAVRGLRPSLFSGPCIPDRSLGMSFARSFSTFCSLRPDRQPHAPEMSSACPAVLAPQLHTLNRQLSAHLREPAAHVLP